MCSVLCLTFRLQSDQTVFSHYNTTTLASQQVVGIKIAVSYL